MDPFEHPSNSNFQLGIQQVKKELDSLDAAVRSRIIEISEVQNSIKECKAAKVDLELSIVREQEEVASLASQIKNIAWLVDERRRRRKACDESCEETKASLTISKC